jgi:hypothetical protein
MIFFQTMRKSTSSNRSLPTTCSSFDDSLRLALKFSTINRYGSENRQPADDGQNQVKMFDMLAQSKE